MENQSKRKVFLWKIKDLGPCITQLASSGGQQRLETGTIYWDPCAKTTVVKEDLLRRTTLFKWTVFCFLSTEKVCSDL